MNVNQSLMGLLIVFLCRTISLLEKKIMKQGIFVLSFFLVTTGVFGQIKFGDKISTRDKIGKNTNHADKVRNATKRIPNYRVYIFDERGTRREYLNTPVVMFDPSKKGNGTYIAFKKVNYDKYNNLIIKRTGKGITDYGYLHRDRNSISKFLQNKHGQNIGLLTITDSKKLVIRLDYNLDGIIDHMEVYDAVNKRTSHFVLETPLALEEYDQMLEGKNIFCSLQRVGSTYKPPTAAFGISAKPNSIYSGCGENGLLSGYGVPKFDFGRKFPNTETTVDNYCGMVLSQSSGNDLGGVVKGGDGEALMKLGSVLGATALLIEGAGASTGPGIVVTTPPAILTGILGAGLVIIGGVVDFFEDDESPVYIPGVDIPTYDWSDFCERRAKNKYCYSLNSLEGLMKKQDCNNPTEGGGKLSSGITSSPSGGRGGGISSGACPWRPYTPPPGKTFCQNEQEHPNLESMWQRLNEEQCNNPVASPSPDGGGCETATVGPPRGKIDIAGADIISPGTTNFINTLLEKVTNPREGIYNNVAYRKN